MKQNFIKAVLLLFTTILFISCKKISEENSLSPSAALKITSQCQLTDFDFGNGTGWQIEYNEQGLPKTWTETGFDVILKLKHNNNKQFSKMDWWENNILSYNIDIENVNGMPVKETIYEGAGKEVLSDEIFNEFDSRGKLTRRESIILGIRVDFVNDANGNATSWKFYINDELYLKDELTYGPAIPNPFLAVTGIKYGLFYWALPFNNWWETGEILTLYENGQSYIIFETDPPQTVFTPGPGGYPSAATEFDLVSNSPVPYTFEFQNCPASAHPGSITNSSKRTAIKTLKMMLHTGMSVPEIKAKVNQFKKKMGK